MGLHPPTKSKIPITPLLKSFFFIENRVTREKKHNSQRSPHDDTSSFKNFVGFFRFVRCGPVDFLGVGMALPSPNID